MLRSDDSARDDDDAWMNISMEELDRTMQDRLGTVDPNALGDEDDDESSSDDDADDDKVQEPPKMAAARAELDKMMHMFSSFLGTSASHEGAELPGPSTMQGDDDDDDINFEMDRFVAALNGSYGAAADVRQCNRNSIPRLMVDFRRETRRLTVTGGWKSMMMCTRPKCGRSFAARM